MTTLLLAAVFAAGPRLSDTAVLPSRCDVLEAQAWYDCDGRYQWTQFIGWVWHDGEHQLAWWRFSKHCSLAGDLLFLRHSDGRLYAVRFRELRRRWSMTDFELEARPSLPCGRRRGP